MISANNLAFGLLCKQALLWQLLKYYMREIYKRMQSENPSSWELLYQINNDVFFTLFRTQNEIDLPVLSLLLSAGNSSTLCGIWCEATVEEEVSRSHSKNVTHDSRCISVSKPCQHYLPGPNGFSLLFQVKSIAKEQTEARSWQSVSREDRRVAALCQTGGYQGHAAAATFQVKG